MPESPQPLEVTALIASRILGASVGDEFTVETADGTKINREVTHVNQPIGHRQELCLGDPDGVHLFIYLDVDERRQHMSNEYEVYATQFTDNFDEPMISRGEVVKLWDWRRYS